MGLDETSNTIIAACLATTASLIEAFAYIIQKKGHNQVDAMNNAEEDISNKKTYLSNCLWITGFILYASGSLIGLIALKFGSQSVVAPLGSLTLVFNTILAAKYLNEPFKYQDIWGICFVITGSVLIIIFGPKSSDEEITLNDIQNNFVQIPFLIFFCTLSFLAIIDFMGVKYFEKLNFKNQEQNKIVYGGKYLLLSYISLAAYFGSINVLFEKSIVIIFSSFSVNYFKDWLFYTIIFGMVIVNICLEFFRQRGLAYFGAIVVVPIYSVLLIIGASMMGAIFFNEFAELQLYQIFMFTVSIIIILIGVVILAVDFGKNIDKFKEYLEVAWLSESQIWENNVSPQFPVWPGALPQHLQNYYLKHTAFVFNEQKNDCHKTMSNDKNEQNLLTINEPIASDEIKTNNNDKL